MADDLLKEILAALKRLENAQDLPISVSRHDARPTGQYPREADVKLLITDAITSHASRCSAEMKERLREKIDPILKKVEGLESSLNGLRMELTGRIDVVKEEASKTATGTVISVVEKAETALRILIGSDGEPGLEEMVRDLGQWVEDEEKARDREKEDAKERSRFNVATFLTILGILTAIGLGVLNLALGR